MSVLYVVFPLALLLALVAVLAYVWAVRSGQFDDTQTPALRILHDDEPAGAGTANGAPETDDPKPGAG